MAMRSLQSVTKHYGSWEARPARSAARRTPRWPDHAPAGQVQTQPGEEEPHERGLADIVGTGFAIDRGPFFDRLRDYLDAEAQAGTLQFRSAAGQTQPASAVAEQFLGMICGQLLWPQLVRTDFIPPDPTDTTIVDEAVALMLTRYRTES